MARSRSAKGSGRASRFWGVGLGLLSLFVLTGLVTYSGSDGTPPGGPLSPRFANAAGIVGEIAARLSLDALGWGGAWVVPILFFVWGWNRFRRQTLRDGLVPTLLGVTLAVSVSSLTAFFWQRSGGGEVGVWVAGGARVLLGPAGGFLFLLVLAVLAVGFVAEREMAAAARACIAVFRHGLQAARRAGLRISGWLRAAFDSVSAARPPENPSRTTARPVPADVPPASDQGPRIVTLPGSREVSAAVADPVEAIRKARDRRGTQLPLPDGRPPREPMAPAEEEPEDVGPIKVVGEDEEIDLPELDLLDLPRDMMPPMDESELFDSSRTLVQTLADFGVVGRVAEVHPGPVITSYEFEPAAGVRISQILNRADDLALALKAVRIRIVAPIPGKAAVGVEIPNRNPVTVYLREILDHPDFRKRKSGLAIALGKDIGGKPFYADLTKMPHLLIAGTTGSGKSVCVNSIITSLIMRKSPRELRLLMIDPKMLELPVYNGIPHLLMPVVTDPKLAARTLRGLITEMERRYAILARRGVRNIDAYHERLDEDVTDGLEVIGERLPYIVAIIDELADLMITTAAEVEEPIGRLAQTARAVGIHLIVATQRPSVDVITGVIKANFPSRIAFQVASRIDSRTILDATGADSLLGKGDMLFMLSGRPELDRVHGAFVSDRDTERLVKFWKRVKPKLPSIDLETEKDTETGGSLGDDPLFEDAARVVVLHQQGSASLLQRRLKVGYSRAARLIDMLEECGIVAPSEGSKAREVLVNEAQLDEILKGPVDETAHS